MLCTIERMDRSSPPGVLSCTIRAWEPSACARSIALASRRTVTGVIAESSSISETGASRGGRAGDGEQRGGGQQDGDGDEERPVDGRSHAVILALAGAAAP